MVNLRLDNKNKYLPILIAGVGFLLPATAQYQQMGQPLPPQYAQVGGSPQYPQQQLLPNAPQAQLQYSQLPQQMYSQPTAAAHMNPSAVMPQPPQAFGAPQHSGMMTMPPASPVPMMHQPGVAVQGPAVLTASPGNGAYTPQVQVTPFEEPPSVMEQALSLHKAGRYADAVHLYEGIIFSTPPDPRLYASIADAHFKLGNHERSLKYAVEAVKLDPDYSSGHLLLGTILGEMGDYVRAVRSYQRVLVLDPNNPYAYYNLGLLHYKKSDVKTAIEYFEKSRELNPNDPKIWNNLGVAYYDQGMFSKAMIAYTEALRVDPQNAEAARNLELLRKNSPPPSRRKTSRSGKSASKKKNKTSKKKTISKPKAGVRVNKRPLKSSLKLKKKK